MDLIKKAGGVAHVVATHEGELKIGERVLPVAVADGKRLISQSAIFIAFGRPKRGSRDQGSEYNAKLPGLIDAQNLKPFITNELNAVIKPISYTNKNGVVVTGYDAIILPLICEVYLEARAAKKEDGKPVLQPRQIANAMAAELVMRSLSKIGIIALVDEATGYQEVRAKDELKLFLEKFLLEEKTKWVRTFPDEFFDMIFKMKGINWLQANKGKKPQWVGHYINDLVYSRLGPEVLYSLRKLNPKNGNGNRAAKHFQYTSPDVGLPKLKEHLNILMAFGKASGYNMNTFKRLVERALPQYSQDGSQVLELPFNDA